MPKQVLELRIELYGNIENYIEMSKLDLMTEFVKAIKSVQSNSSRFGTSATVTIKTNIVTNQDVFKELQTQEHKNEN